MTQSEAVQATHTSAFELFKIFLRLGLTSFGGPVAHLGYFRHEFVEKRKWLDDRAYADLVGLCQLLPGPASSQVGIAVGLIRGGKRGALASWLGFTLPSAIALVLFAVFFLGDQDSSQWLHGLKVVAVAVVAQAIWAMGKSLCPDRKRASMAVAATLALAMMSSAWGQILVILAGAIVGWVWLDSPSPNPSQHRSSAIPQGNPLQVNISQKSAMGYLGAFFILLFLLPLLAHHGAYWLQLFDSFYRSGALVFGGGHVVLPLLQAEVVPNGWVSNDDFIAGYGAAQAVPGPLFTFAAYLGAISSQTANAWMGASVALVGIFTPAFLLVFGTLPLWQQARTNPTMQKAMAGINASVVGILLSAFYNPIWTSAILTPKDFSLAIAAFLLLVFWKAPPWLVVVFCALVAALGWH